MSVVIITALQLVAVD